MGEIALAGGPAWAVWRWRSRRKEGSERGSPGEGSSLVCTTRRGHVPQSVTCPLVTGLGLGRRGNHCLVLQEGGFEAEKEAAAVAVAVGVGRASVGERGNCPGPTTARGPPVPGAQRLTAGQGFRLG